MSEDHGSLPDAQRDAGSSSPQHDRSESKVTRRGFLNRTTQAGAAALAVPYFTTARFAHGDTEAARVPPSERIRIGLIGAGGQAGYHVGELLKEPDAEIVAVCDVWKERREQRIAQSGGTAAGYHDYRDVLAREDIDAVLISTPPHWHALQAIHACEAGKDVYLEKPMTLSIGETLAVVRAARKHDRITQVGTQIHATGNYRRLVDIVRSGVLGGINVVRAFHVLNQGPEGIGYPESHAIPDGLDWEMWKGPGPERPFNPFLVEDSYLHASFMYTGGWTPNMAPHLIDLPFWALELGLPTSVSSSGGRYIVRDCGDAYDTHEVFWQFPNLTLQWMTSLVNSYAFDFQQQPGIRRRRGIYFHGVNGTLLADYGFRKCIPEGDRMKAMDIEQAPRVIPESPGHHREWLDGIRTRRQPSCHVGYHYRIDIALNLSLMSLKLGRSIRFDPETETIVNDPEATKLAIPEYRDPWRLPAEYLT